jgi:hypothetical protein
VSDGGTWQPPDPGAARAGIPGPTVELESSAPPSAPRRSPAVAIAAVVGGAAVFGAAVFGITRLVDDGGAGGAATPEEAGLALLTAFENEDVLGMMDVLLPGERETLKDPLVELTDELSRVEVLSNNATLSDVAGVDIELEGESVEVEETNVDDIVNLGLSATSGTAIVNGEELPIGDLVLDNLPDDADVSELDAEDELEEGEPLLLELTAVEQDGRWYISLFHTIAENVRRTAEEPIDIPAEGVTPVGGDSPEDAVDAFLGGLQALDLETIIATLNPDEFQALQRYAPSFLADAQADLDEAVADEGVSVEIADPEYTVSGSGDTRSLSIDYLRVDVTDQEEAVIVEYEDGCWKASGGGEEFNSCELDADPSTLKEMFDDPEPVQNLLTTLQDALADYENPGFIVKQVDGEWYLSPVATVSEQLLAVLRALDRDEIETIVEDASDAFEAGLDTEFDSGAIFGNVLSVGNGDFKSDAESFIEDDTGSVEAQLGIGLDQATCEEPASTEVGTVFACTALGDDGSTYEFSVEITGDNTYEVGGGTPAD